MTRQYTAVQLDTMLLGIRRHWLTDVDDLNNDDDTTDDVMRVTEVTSTLISTGLGGKLVTGVGLT